MFPEFEVGNTVTVFLDLADSPDADFEPDRPDQLSQLSRPTALTPLYLPIQPTEALLHRPKFIPAIPQPVSTASRTANART